MSSQVRIVKSPLPYGIEKLPTPELHGNMIVSIMLPGGIAITNPEHFEETDVKTEESHVDESE